MLFNVGWAWCTRQIQISLIGFKGEKGKALDLLKIHFSLAVLFMLHFGAYICYGMNVLNVLTFLLR